MMITDSMLTNFAEGQQVMFGKYCGTITKVCTGQLQGMYEVRLDKGLTCVCGSDLRPKLS